MNNASLAQWLSRLETLHPSSMDLGLERISQVARVLELLPVTVPVVTIAGTNGKGSTAAMLEAVLTQAGQRPGCFTSPHFLRFNERIRIGGQEVGDDDIVRAFETIEQARGEVSLTYFEFAALAALLVFRELAADTYILEVGLGGRLDAVNIVDADVAIITSIDLDHQEWLGDSLGLIAREKAAIARRGRPAVIGESRPLPELRQRLEKIGANPIYQIGRDFDFSTGTQHWSGRMTGRAGEELELPSQNSGSLAPENICCALQAAELMGVRLPATELKQVLEDVQIPGRRQLLQIGSLEYLLDVAHNPAAVGKLLEYMDENPSKGRTVALFSAMQDKDLATMLQPCESYFDAWFLAEQPDNVRAASAGEIAALLRQAGQGMISESKNIRQAFRRAQSLLTENDRLVVFGSFFTVAAVLPQLEKERKKDRAC